MNYNDVIYQIFPRNHYKGSNFKSIEDDLERIKELGVTIIYLMPIHIIGIKNRKGTYGSPYAIKDYFSIDPLLGDLKDFKSLVNKTHALGMKIILDMVFNHTAPDNVLLDKHEDYYFHKNGKLSNRVGDWSDIVDLDTYKDETQLYLISVLKYWISQGVDGFRFDVASMIPLDFFIRARKEVGKDIIFVGESIDLEFSAYLRSINETATLDDDMYPTFDSLYNYHYFRYFEKFIANQGTLQKIVDVINNDKLNMRMLCFENHDVARITSLISLETLKCWLDFYSFIKGQVFLYEGQEYGIKHKPELFEYDPVKFDDIDNNIYLIYKDYINKKKSQKEIIDQHIDVIAEDKVKVTVKYIDNTTETKEFVLPR